MARFCRTLLIVSVLACAGLAQAEGHRWYLGSFTGQSLTFMGSQDPRTGNGLSLAHDFGPQARLRWGPLKGNLIGEAYYSITRSPGVRSTPPNSSVAWGLLAMARYRWTETDAPTTFIDVGWGLQMASRTTRDLPARLNSTPVVDLGVVMGREHERMLVAARFIHISNGGIVNKGEKNKGQNQLYLLVQVPF